MVIFDKILTQMPKISVVVPCYNQAQYLDECLQSVLNQTYQDWECIIVNDGSPDNTEEIAKNWVEKDTRFIYLSKENGGLSSARNAGIEIAKGEWILPLDADDKIGDQYLELAEKEFEKDYTVIYCEAEFFGNEIGKWHLPEFSLENLAKKNCIFCSAFYKKEDWKKVNGYDINMIYGLEDYEFWISLLKNKNTVKKLPQTLFYYRVKENSMLTNLKSERINKMFNYISKKHTDFFLEYLGSFNELFLLQENILKKYDKLLNSKKIKFLEFILKPYDNFIKYIKQKK